MDRTIDKLEEIFRLQEAFDTELARRRGLEFGFEEWIQRETLAILSELGELLDEVNFKWWKDPKPIDRARVTEELVDILHFFVSACIKAGLDADTLYRAYTGKNRENFRRQDGQSDRPGYRAPD